MAIALANGGKPGSMRAMSNERRGNGTQVVIVGGGVAGLETLLALDDLAGERVALTLVAPQPDFVYKPLLVEEPFDLGPAERHELEPLTAEKGAEFVLSAVSSVRPEDHVVELDDGSTLQYDYLVVCAGGRFKPAIDGATTFPGGEVFSADGLLDRAEAKDHRIAFIVPAGVTWSLPLYELALMTQRRAAERRVDAKIAVITPESAPLAIFGPARERRRWRAAGGERHPALHQFHRARPRWSRDHAEPRRPKDRPVGINCSAADGRPQDRWPAGR